MALLVDTRISEGTGDLSCEETSYNEKLFRNDTK